MLQNGLTRGSQHNEFVITHLNCHSFSSLFNLATPQHAALADCYCYGIRELGELSLKLTNKIIRQARHHIAQGQKQLT